MPMMTAGIKSAYIRAKKVNQPPNAALISSKATYKTPSTIQLIGFLSWVVTVISNAAVTSKMKMFSKMMISATPWMEL